MHTATTAPRIDVRGDSMPLARVIRAYATEVKYESLRMLRAPAFSIGLVVVPIPVYLFFGVLLAAPAIAKHPGIGAYLFSGFSTFAIMGPALFGVGCTLAIERDAGLLKLKRAWPAPDGAYLIAKMLMAVLFAALLMVLMVTTGVLAGKASLSAAQFLALSTALIVGALPFAAIGLFIGAYSSGSAAPAFVNIAYLPQLWLSGLFFPLPKFLEPWAVIWPAFHANQVALAAAGVNEFVFLPPLISAGVLIGITVLFGGLAIRRLARHG
jgi:ABC-2 type transport system permease protein